MHARHAAVEPSAVPSCRADAAGYRRLPRLLAGLALPSALLVMVSACGGGGWTEEEIASEAPRVHADAIVVDTHIDAPESHIRDDEWSAADLHVYSTEDRRPGLWDIPRMFDGGLDAAFLVVYVGQGPNTEEGFARGYETALGLFDWCDAAVASHPDAELARSPEDIRRLHAEGKKALLIGVENGYPIGNDLGRLQEFYDRGMRYMTLSHNGDNQICASCNPRRGDREEGAGDHGLTEFGRRVVAELNRLGVIIDVSHISDQSFYDAVETSTAPIIASHSGARAVCDNSRNLTDDMLLKLKENGGVIQLVALTSFIREEPENPERDAAVEALEEEYGNPEDMTEEQQREMYQRVREIRRQFPTPDATVEDFMILFDHVVGLIGIDHVGFGSDFDGGGGIAGLEDVSKLPVVTNELMRRGYSERDIRKFWGGNLLRVFEQVQAAADRQ